VAVGESAEQQRADDRAGEVDGRRARHLLIAQREAVLALEHTGQ
jgi:hypothetical protein